MTTSPLAICVAALAILSAPDTAIAKCATTEIVLRGPGIADALSIAAPEGATLFNVWNGPRVRMNGEAYHLDPAHARGRFIDWPSGAIAAPHDDTLNFRASFYCIFDVSTGPEQIYEIDYAFSPGVDGGYVYLPGRDDARYASNVATIVHGIEGSWYRSTQDWERVIRPILESAVGTQGGQY